MAPLDPSCDAHVSYYVSQRADFVRSESHMRLHWNWWQLAVVPLAVVGWLAWPEFWLHWSVARFTREAARALPVGSTRASVESWLRSRSDHTSYFSAPGPADEIGHETVIARAGLDAGQLGGCLRSQFGSSNVMLCDTIVYAYFFFDKNERLVKMWTEWHYQSL
jgi:hypothetical protein